MATISEIPLGIDYGDFYKFSASFCVFFFVASIIAILYASDIPITLIVGLSNVQYTFLLIAVITLLGLVVVICKWSERQKKLDDYLDSKNLEIIQDIRAKKLANAGREKILISDSTGETKKDSRIEGGDLEIDEEKIVGKRSRNQKKSKGF